MPKLDRYLVDVGMQKLPFPMRVPSRERREGQHTIANISVHARIMQEFEAQWIDRFIQIIHKHRENIGPRSIATNIIDYQETFKASSVRIDFAYPVFLTKKTPVSQKECLVKYDCVYSAKMPTVDNHPKIIFKIDVPVITTDPFSDADKPGGLFGQLSLISIEVEPVKEIYPEDIVDLVDSCALAPIYSFMTPEDKESVIHRVHTEEKSSVMVVDEIKNQLARNTDISWYSIRSSNYGMLHPYHTLVGTERQMWVPFSTYDE